MDFELFGNGRLTLLRLMAATIAPLSSLYFFLFKIQNAPEQRTAKTSAFIEVITLADDQLLKDIWLAAPDCYLHS